MSVEDSLGLKSLDALVQDLQLTIEGVAMLPRTQHGACMQQQMDFVRDMAVREDDVFISACRKAGTHWVWEMVTMLLRGRADPVKECKENCMLEITPTSDLLKVQSPRVFNTHLPFRLLPRQALEKRSKVIHVTRNPKDVAVSSYCMLEGKRPGQTSFQEFLDFFLHFQAPVTSNWFFLTRDWERVLEEHPDHPILVLSYEDMKEDPARELGRLAAFLEVQASEGLVRDIVKACDFQAMRKAESIKNNPILRIHPNLIYYRKGEVGDWKNWFTVANNEVFDQVYAHKMADTRWRFRYSL